MSTPHDVSTGLSLEATKLPSPGPTVELFGHVTLVHGYVLTNFIGCYALVALRDQPGTTVAGTYLRSEPARSPRNCTSNWVFDRFSWAKTYKSSNSGRWDLEGRCL
jgi:hypothetical protein